MILDFEHELTTADGQLFDANDTATKYGTIPYDLGKTSPEDPAISGDMDLWVKVHEDDVNNVTSLGISLVTDTDGAGTSAVAVIPEKTILLASLSEGTRHYIGTMKKFQTMKRYLTLAVKTNGTPATEGKLKAWLVPAGTLPTAGTWT